MATFELHSQLAADTVFIKSLGLCDVLLQKDANYPWLNLVPRVHSAREIHALPFAQQQQLMAEISFISERFEKLTGAFKLNVASIGNMVPQMHVHIVARFEGDAAWPAPIWGVKPRKAYGAKELEKFVTKLQEAFNA